MYVNLANIPFLQILMSVVTTLLSAGMRLVSIPWETIGVNATPATPSGMERV